MTLIISSYRTCILLLHLHFCACAWFKLLEIEILWVAVEITS